MANKPPLTPSDNRLSSELAIRAIQTIGKPSFTVYACLDIEKPETLANFDTLGRVLLDAYKEGFVAASAPTERNT